MPLYAHTLTRRGLMDDVVAHLFTNPEHYVMIPDVVYDILADDKLEWDEPLPTGYIVAINLWMIRYDIGVMPGPFTFETDDC